VQINTIPKLRVRPGVTMDGGVAGVPTLGTVDSTIAAAYVAAGAAVAAALVSVIATRSAAGKGAQAALDSAERTAKATLDATKHNNDTTLEITRLTLAADADRRLWENAPRCT
jgi:hypothetical protein